MSQARALSSDEVRGLREELTSGNSPTVWFTSSAVGVPEGRSGKVTALDDSEEGDFIQVRPAGTKDVLSFSPGEVTLVKPPRKRKEQETPAPARNGTANSPAGAKAAGAKSAQQPTAGGAQAAAASAGSAAKSAAPAKPESSGEAKSDGSRSANGTGRRKPRQPTPATVTLTADQTGQWSVEVTTGKKRVLRPMQVSASAVGQAAKALHDDVAEAVEPLLEAAREQQRVRVEQLQQELADAQRALEELTE